VRAVSERDNAPMLYLGEKVGIQEMAKGDCLFSATGVTAGSLLSGVKFRGNVIETESIAMLSVSSTARIIEGEHRQLENPSALSGHGALVRTARHRRRQRCCQRRRICNEAARTILS
jgi:fructose-1,6-bisphosphatase/sedoheptulose 1,7-bisphosphatase-like protein